MGFIAKRGPTEIYGKLLVLYPARYRQKYEKPMVQTFDDMLKDEPRAFKKSLIWARTLLDLPISAAKEHLTDGKELVMNRKMKFIFGGVIVLLLLANGASWWYGNLHSRQTSGIEKVSVAQLADAMESDSFYSSYGNAGLLFTGNVSDVQKNGDTALVTFSSNGSYAVTCQFVHGSQIKNGDMLSVAAPGGSAERLKNGVLLHNCLEV